MNHLVNFRGFRYFLKSCQLPVWGVHDNIGVPCQGSNPFCKSHFPSASLAPGRAVWSWAGLRCGLAGLGLEVQQPAAADRLCSAAAAAQGSAPPLIGSGLQEDERHYCFLLMLR